MTNIAQEWWHVLLFLPHDVTCGFSLVAFSKEVREFFGLVYVCSRLSHFILQPTTLEVVAAVAIRGQVVVVFNGDGRGVWPGLFLTTTNPTTI